MIREKAYTLKGRITNTSALGFQIEMVESLTAGETIRLTVDGYHLLGRVQHCVRSDSAFKIGVERVDEWEGKVSDGAPMSPVMTRPLPVLGRPELKNPLGDLRACAVRALFANPRFTSSQTKYQTRLIFAGSMVLAASLAGFAGWGSHGVPSTAVSKAGASKALPVEPTTQVNAAPRKTETANLSDTGIGAAPSTPQARSVAPVISTASSVVGSAHSISIKASGPSWVTAWADGVIVFGKLFNKGDVEDVRFSHQATLRSGNAGALELTIGNQSIPMGEWGEVRTIMATPTGYEFVTPASTPNLQRPVKLQATAFSAAR